MTSKITHYVCRSTACGSANNGDHRVPVSLAPAPWEHDPAGPETRPRGRTVRGATPAYRALAGAALASSLKRIIREVAQEMESEQ